jgi:hypothetical protein
MDANSGEPVRRNRHIRHLERRSANGTIVDYTL